MSTLLDPQIITTAEAQYQQGKLLQCYETLKSTAAFPDTSNPQAWILAIRVVGSLGAARLANAWHRQAFRAFADHPQTRYYAVLYRYYHAGPLRAWQWWHKLDPLPGANSEEVADWLALKAEIAAQLQDFELAEQLVQEALALAPERSWVLLQWGSILEKEDRWEEALAAHRQALEKQPSYAPAICSVARALQSLNRSEEAADLLSDAAQALESGSVVYTLALVQHQLQRFAEAQSSLDQLDLLFPLQDKVLRRDLAGLRSLIAYELGDVSQAIHWSQQSTKDFFMSVAENMQRAAPDANRVVLPVEFVRQHRMTCAPATLTALSRYWNRPVQHLEIAEKICYDGTPSQSERTWAQQNDFVGREFTVDWESAKALIDRGIPFTLTSVETDSAHLQAIVGYDERRHTLILRDSNSPNVGETLADKGLQRYAAFGPRGMTLIPTSEAHRLEGIVLPDAELFDKLYAIQCSLEQHDRTTASQILEQLQAEAPDHRLTHQARLTLCRYDNDMSSAQHSHEQLVRLFPDSETLLFYYWQYLSNSAPRDARLEYLKKNLAKFPDSISFRQALMEELSVDARTTEEMEYHLRRLLRKNWFSPAIWRSLAIKRWDQQRYDEATQAFRWSACLADKDENYVWSYFLATGKIHRQEKALAWLRSRVDRLGKRSSAPAQTLFRALEYLDRITEGFEALDAALRQHPDDAGLRLYLTDAHARYGNFSQAAEHLAAAKKNSHHGQWLHTAADLAAYQGDLNLSLELRQQELALNPQSADCNQSVARLLSQLHGEAAAREHMQAQLDRFPHNVALLQKAIVWFRDVASEQHLTLLQRLIEVNPTDTWARRELAIALFDMQQLDNALAEAEVALQLDPTHTDNHALLGYILTQTGKPGEAREAYRRSIELSVDNSRAIYGLLQTSSNYDQRRQSLEFTHDQLVRQTMLGDGLLTWYDCAKGIFSFEEIVERLEAARQARPELWHCWTALVRAYGYARHLEKAQQLANELVERFPMASGSWVELAQVCSWRNDCDGEIAALEHARSLSPTWERVLSKLAEAYEQKGDLAACRDFLQQAIRMMPLDSVLHGQLANTQWSLGEHEHALLTVQHALKLDMDYDWAWDALHDWGKERQQPRRAVDLAQELVQERPRNATAWLWLARMHVRSSQWDEAEAATQRALELQPGNPNFHALLAKILSETGRIDEALAACRPAIWGDSPPAVLEVEQAHIVMRQGDSRRAIAILHAAMQRQTDHFAGWRLLADWCDESQQDAEVFLEAATHLTRLAPNQAWCWAHLGDAHRARNDSKNAGRAFEQAIEVDPRYEYSRLRLVDLAIDNHDYDLAHKAIATPAPDSSSEYLLARQVKLHAAQGDSQQALEAFDRLIHRPHSGEWPMQTATQALWQIGGNKLMFDALHRASQLPGLDSQVYQAWANAFVSNGKPAVCLKELKTHPVGGEHWKALVTALLEATTDTKDETTLQTIVNRYAQALRQDDVLWGLVANNYNQLLQPHKTIHWMHDWATRPEAAPWMLLHQVTSFFDVGRFSESQAVCRRALELPADHAINPLRTMLMVMTCGDGNWDEAAALHAELRQCELNPYHQAWLEVVEHAHALRRALSVDPSWQTILSTTRAFVSKAESYQSDLTFNRCEKPVMRAIYLQLIGEAGLRTWPYTGLYLVASGIHRIWHLPRNLTNRLVRWWQA